MDRRNQIRPLIIEFSGSWKWLIDRLAGNPSDLWREVGDRIESTSLRIEVGSLSANRITTVTEDGCRRERLAVETARQKLRQCRISLFNDFTFFVALELFDFTCKRAVILSSTCRRSSSTLICCFPAASRQPYRE